MKIRTKNGGSLMRQTQLPHEKPRLIGGIDEAGRGSVIGPLVVAGVVLPETKLDKLIALEVKDSKQLSPAKRNELFGKILKLTTKWEFAEISPQSIDAAIKTEKSNLNKLELQHMARICLSLAPDTVYVDALGPDARVFEAKLWEVIQLEGGKITKWALGREYSHGESTVEKYNLQIIAENKADETIPVVSAASILAKVQRDQQIEKLKVKCGEDFGSGYPSDPLTRTTLKKWIAQGVLPAFVRKQWETIKELQNKLSFSKTKPLNQWFK